MPSYDRGYVYLPNVTSRDEVDALSRTELDTRGCYLYNNVGVVKGIIDGIARMVCGTGLMPEPLTLDKKWNKRFRELYLERCGSATTFDLAQRYNVFSAQRALIRTKNKRGDALAVLARNEDNRLRVAFYEANQIGNGNERSPDWHDGVKLDAHNAALAYRILGRSRDGKATQVDVDAANARHIASYERIGQVRGLTCLYHAVNKMVDRGEILNAVTKGIKSTANQAYVIEQQLPNGGPQIPGAPGAGLGGVRPKTTVQKADGSVVSLEKLLGGGEAWDLQPGQSFKIVANPNPSQNVQDHLDYIVRDMAAGTPYPYEVLWKIAELGGANTRFIMSSTQQSVAIEQDELVDQFLAPHYIAFAADLIAHGDIWAPMDEAAGLPDPRWYAHGWLSDGRLTVDFGRDGRLYLEQYDRGLITMKALHGFTGEQWQVELNQYLDERQQIIQGCMDRKITEHDGTVRSLTLQEAYPKVYSSAPTAPSEPDSGPVDEPTPKKKPKPGEEDEG